MPDTGPITDSFPWLVICRYTPVYDGIKPVLVSDDSLFVLTDDSGTLILTPDNPQGNLYRYI
jgi:hypothetical protein